MKKFIKNNLIIILMALVTISCTQEKTEEVDDNGFFFDVVYQTTATRENPNKAWIGVNGIMQMKISQSTDSEGTFIFFYQNYKEPQFVYNICSGGFKGNFSFPDDSTTTPDDPAYNIMNPYVADTGSGTTTTTEDPNATPVDQINNYKLQLSITFRSLDVACRPEADRIIAVYRFTNGDVIVKSEYRELLMRPVLTSDSQIQ